MSSQSLTLPQALVLLALRDEDGTFMGSWQKLVFAGAILSELYLRGILGSTGRKGKLVKVLTTRPTGSAALDDAVNLIACANKPKSLKRWVERLGNRSQSQRLLLEELIAMGALTSEQKKILLVFNATRWPEANGSYEAALKQNMADAMFTNGADVSERIGTTICLANQANLLKRNFDREQLSAHKRRIKQITDGAGLANPATKSAISAVQGAIVAATAAATVAAVG